MRPGAAARRRCPGRLCRRGGRRPTATGRSKSSMCYSTRRTARHSWSRRKSSRPAASPRRGDIAAGPLTARLCRLRGRGRCRRSAGAVPRKPLPSSDALKGLSPGSALKKPGSSARNKTRRSTRSARSRRAPRRSRRTTTTHQRRRRLGLCAARGRRRSARRLLQKRTRSAVAGAVAGAAVVRVVRPPPSARPWVCVQIDGECWMR